MKKLSLITLFFLSVAGLSAQVNYTRCGTYELMQHRETLNPGYLQRTEACFERAKQIAQQNAASRAIGDTVYRIRTVFHVVYTSAAENIPDSVILSQLEVLNEDYRRRNADAVNTRGVFLPVAGDPGIEFYLADTDPDGNPTTGITRTQGSPGFLGFEPFSDNVKSAASGGKDPWPTDRYLNIWICNILNGFGVLGYAFPPDNAPNWPANSSTDSAKQGVVIHFPVTGRNYTAPIDPTVDMGRSLVHELGHYLGLRHIWGDGDCTVDDGISDTPDADAAHQQTCDTTSNSCVESPVDFPDMVENFMDYSDDRCLNMFTKEQIGVMRAMLQTSRAGIATPVIETAIAAVRDNFEAVNVSPSPTTGLINLNVQLRNGGHYSFEILNVIGEKLVAQTDIHSTQDKLTLDLSEQPSGVYFVRIASGDQVVVRKFQISK